MSQLSHMPWGRCNMMCQPLLADDSLDVISLQGCNFSTFCALHCLFEAFLDFSSGCKAW